MENQDQNRTNGSDSGAPSHSAAETRSDPPAGSPSRSASEAQNNAALGMQGGSDDLMMLMEQSPKTRGLGAWMKCLRKPALSMQYTVEKHHVPDMDAPAAGQTAGRACNTDDMSVKGGFTIRYFDFAAGILTLLVTGCVMKMICRVKKMM